MALISYIEDSFLSIYPQYKKEFINYFYNSRASYPFQMFIATKERYDDYCSFMFPVLFQAEKIMKPHGYTRQKRTIGYFGEYFLGLYIACKHLKVRPIPIDDESLEEKSWSKLHVFVRKQVQFLRGILVMLQDMLYRKPTEIIVPDAVAVGFRADGIKLKALK